MKKTAVAILIIVLVTLFVSGCGAKNGSTSSSGLVPTQTLTPKPTVEPTAEVPVRTEPEVTAVVEKSPEDQLNDLRHYADLYTAGQWDGEAIDIPGWDKYARITSDGYLRVGYLSAIPGATTGATTVPELIAEYEDGAWVCIGDGYKIWSEDYSCEYSINSSGFLSSHSDDAYEPCLFVVDSQIYEGEAFDAECLAEMFRNNDWDGGRLWCPTSGQVAYCKEAGIEIYTPNVGWMYTCVFPALGEALPCCWMGWIDAQSALTVAITSEGVGLYRPDGTVVTIVSCEYDDDNAFVAPAQSATNDMFAFAYGGGDVIYGVDFREQTIAPIFNDVVECWYGMESSMEVQYIDPMGLMHTDKVWLHWFDHWFD